MPLHLLAGPRGFEVSHEGIELSFLRPEEFGHELRFDYALKTPLITVNRLQSDRGLTELWV